MIPARYVWLVWSGLFFAVWTVLFLTLRTCRTPMLISSLLAVPFGASEPFFLSSYWHPPTLFDLANKVNADLETFLFCFSIGGTAAVGYHLVTRRPWAARTRSAGDDRWLGLYCVALVAPLPAFLIVAAVTQQIFWAGTAGFVVGVAARLASRGDLIAKSLIGGAIFLAYYALMLIVLVWIAPGYIELAWSAQGPAAVRLFHVPLAELIFGLTFGLYWSGLFEQIAWLFVEPSKSPSHANETRRGQL